MIIYLRYTLATLCFAASVGCLALWWRSTTTRDAIFTPTLVFPERPVWIDVYGGHVEISLGLAEESRGLSFKWHHIAQTLQPDGVDAYRGRPLGYFHARGNNIIFPLWYPALVIAVSGIGVMNLHRQFTVRSALVGTTLVAALIGTALLV